MIHNCIALVLILKCLLDRKGKQRRRGLSHADEDIKHCVLNLTVKTLRTLFNQRWRNHQSWHIRIPKSHNLIWRIGAALQKNWRSLSNSVSPIDSQNAPSGSYISISNLACDQPGSGLAEVSVKTSTDLRGLMWEAELFFFLFFWLSISKCSFLNTTKSKNP